jgi:hypothetical protein
MRLGSELRGRLKGRLVTAGSGIYGIDVLIAKLARTAAHLWMAARDFTALPANHEEQLFLDVDLPGVPRFGRRYLHCQATVSSVAKGGDETLAVALTIHKMRIIVVPQQAARAGSSTKSGGEQIQ